MPFIKRGCVWLTFHFFFYVFLERYYFVSKLTQSWKGLGWKALYTVTPPWLSFLWQHYSEIRTWPTRGTRLLPKYNFQNNLFVVEHCIFCILQDYYRRLVKTTKSYKILEFLSEFRGIHCENTRVGCPSYFLTLNQDWNGLTFSREIPLY